MKPLKLTGLAALVLALGATSSCDWLIDEPETLDTPTGLTATAITHSSATLAWDTVEDAESYLVRMGDSPLLTATTNTLDLTDLTAETHYTWNVRAVKGDTMSEWSAMSTFTTEAEPVVEPLVYTHAVAYFMEGYYTDRSNFMIELADFDINGPLNGNHLVLDLITELIEPAPGAQFIDIPEGVYTFADTEAAGTLNLNSSFIYVWNAGVQVSERGFSEGTVTFTGDHTGYDITVEAVDIDGEAFNAIYHGMMTVYF
jgi:hypothetical protein